MVRLPAWLVLGSWFVLQYLYTRGAGVSEAIGTAYLAHVIGFVVGAALVRPLPGTVASAHPGGCRTGERRRSSGSSHPTADIRAYSLALDRSTIAVSVALGAFDLASAQSSTFNVELDTDGDAASAEVYPGGSFSAVDPVDCPSAALSDNATDKSVVMSAAASRGLGRYHQGCG